MFTNDSVFSDLHPVTPEADAAAVVVALGRRPLLIAHQLRV